VSGKGVYLQAESYVQIDDFSIMRRSTLIILFLIIFFGKNLFAQSFFTDKVWIGSMFSAKDSESLMDGFAIYYFNSNGILETHDTNSFFSWKYSRRSNVLKISNNKQSFSGKIIQNTKDTLILNFQKNKYIFSLVQDSTSINTSGLIDTLIINRIFFNAKSHKKAMILNENNSIDFVEENINYDILTEKKWKLFHFRNYYFIMIYPDIIVYQLIKTNNDFSLISINKQKSSDFSTICNELKK
jgi:hypothetical protein